MPDFTVIQRGTDPNGRPLFATAYMWAWWDRVCADLGFAPTIVQGAFMARAGGGAAASAGYHDLGGCFDLRVWNLTPDQINATVRVTRRLGAGSWIRDAQRGGMDPHIHLVLGSDQPLATGAAWQWREYVEGNDGLADRGSDYHWRPRPLVTTPPEDEMAQYDALLKGMDDKLNLIVKRQQRQANRTRIRLLALIRQGKATRKDLEALLEELDDEAGDESPRS